jgi:hypothetical protein
MPLYFAIAVTLVLTAVAFAVVSVYAGFVVIPLALILLVYLFLARRSEDPRAGTIERARTGPTGVVRNGAPGAGTANERVGQG